MIILSENSEGIIYTSIEIYTTIICSDDIDREKSTRVPYNSDLHVSHLEQKYKMCMSYQSGKNISNINRNEAGLRILKTHVMRYAINTVCF